MKKERIQNIEETTEYKKRMITKKSYKNFAISLVVLVISFGIVIGIIYGFSLAKELF